VNSIPTIEGEVTPDKEDLAFMDQLDDLYPAPDYGLLLFKGDPAAFRIGKEEWITQQSHEPRSQDTPAAG